ncbi:hypothetical protein BJX99DRAFT_44104 [Aspergillus californicus]
MVPNLHLANGHLLNLQPRSGSGKGATTNSDTNDTIDSGKSASELQTRSEGNDSRRGISKTPLPRSRLPVLKVFTDKEYSHRRSTASSNQKDSGGTMEHDSPKSTDQERERYWRKVRDKLDRDSPSSRNKDKQSHGTYRKIISMASSPRQEIAKHKWKYSGGSSVQDSSTPDASPATKTNNALPESRAGSSKSPMIDQNRSSKVQARANSNHSTNSSGSVSQSDNTANSSYNSNSSVSPILGPTTSTKEWEDRFVVHMPSAREPNPPIMGVSQISDYQRSIEKVHTEGDFMLDPNTLPSPRTTTPEDSLQCSERNGKRVGNLDGQDSRPPSNKNGEDANPNHRRYYCPDEVGKQRFSTIWEESSTRPKPKPRQANLDGSFLGCKEINGPDDRNPDEILFFSTPERPKVVSVSPRTSSLPKDSRLAAMRQMKRVSVQEEWEPISQSLKHAQCSKPSPKPLCREVQCQQLEEKKSMSPKGKEAPDTTGNPTSSSENSKSDPKADHVLIITPTITRTMVTMTDLSSHLRRNSAVREPTSRSAGEIITDARIRLPINTKGGVSPSGLRRVSQTSWGKLNAPSAIPSNPTKAKHTPIVNHPAESKVTTPENSTAVNKSRGMCGLIRTPEIPNSSTDPQNDPFLTKPSDPAASSPASRAGNIPRLTTPHSPAVKNQNARSTSRVSFSPPAIRSSSHLRGTMQAKIVDVAELDGQQVDDRREHKFNAKLAYSNCDQRNNDIKYNTKEGMASETLHTIVDMIFLFVTQVQGFCYQMKANRSSKVVLLKLFLSSVLSMLEHCLQVLKKGLAAISTYNTTGAWPKAHDKDSICSLAEVSQAMVYLAILAFIVVIIARAVGFVVLIGAWIVWFARPLALAVRTAARVLSF